MQTIPTSSLRSLSDPAGLKDGLAFVICGMEHTGTTLISDLFRQAPGVDAGFEVGVMQCLKPRDFPRLKPFSDNILAGWGLTEPALAHCCDTDVFGEFYRRLRAASTVIKPGTQWIFDKTPRYIAVLDRVLANCDVPVLVSYKDPRAIVFSDFKRAKPNSFDAWYSSYLPPKHAYMTTCYEKWKAFRENPRVHSLSLEMLAMNARATMEAMFARVKMEFKIEYALMQGLRYKNTRGTFVSAEVAFEFRLRLSSEQQKRIAADFSKFDDWFYV